MAQDVTEAIILQRIEFQKYMTRAGHWISCINCLHFNSMSNTGEICDLYKARPPAHVIATGCKAHLDDIPF